MFEVADVESDSSPGDFYRYDGEIDIGEWYENIKFSSCHML